MCKKYIILTMELSSIYIEIGSYAIRLYPQDILYITVLLKKIDVTVCSVHLIHKKWHYISAFYNFYWIFFATLLVYVIIIKFI